MTPRDRDEQRIRDLEAARAPLWGALIAIGLAGIAAAIAVML